MDCVLQPPFPGRLAAVGIARRVGFRDWGLRRVWGHAPQCERQLFTFFKGR